MPDTTRSLRLLGAISVIEGVALALYACYLAIEGASLGTPGPSAVSNASALVTMIVIFAIFGVGMIAIGVAWVRGVRWVRGPFVLAQLLLLLAMYQLAAGASAGERIVGILVVAISIAGLVLAFSPAVMRRYTEE